MANNSISLVNLDFDTLKANLKTYLKSQSQFSDYDFDGSNMSVLLDILSYNTHLNAFYMNMAVSEMFLDSAQLRNSVISRSKELNYIPRSAKSSQALINIRIQQSNLSSFTIPFGTKFTGKSSNGTFQYSTDKGYIIYPANGVFQANVSIYEGRYLTDAFVVDESIEAQRFIMSNDNIDTDSLTILLSENDGQVNTYLTKAENLYGLKANSSIYFLQATEDTRYEIVFGDGVFGRKPLDNSVIYSEYRVCSGASADGSTNFTLDDNLGPVNGIGSISSTITVINSSSGGAGAETLESIRFNAPRYFQTQERAITTNDFSAIITQQYQNIKNVYVYGGELALGTPKFGTVLIAPITYSGAILSQTEKNSIETFLKPRTTIGITPVIVDPDYLYVLITTNVKYNSRATILSDIDIQSLCKQAIQTYNNDELLNFNTELNLSRLENIINDIDASVIGNQSEIMIKKIFKSEVFENSFPSIAFRNEIVPGTLISSEFLSLGKRYQYTDFNPNNNTLVVDIIDGKTVINNTSNVVYIKDITNPASISYQNSGTIDYVAGTVSINSIQFTSFEGKTGLEFSAKPLFQDVSSKENDAIAIDVQAGIQVNIRSVDG